MFTLIYEVNNLLLFKTPSNYIVNLIPHWLLWYLTSLYIWRLTLPKLARFKGAIFLLILASLALGLVTDFGNTYGLSRTVYFWPFFLLGHSLGKDFRQLRCFAAPSKPYWAFVLIITLTTFYFLNDLNRFLFYGSQSYAQLNLSNIDGLSSRSFIYTVSLLNALAVLTIIPEKLALPPPIGKPIAFIYIYGMALP